jgi:hypothetical protein
MSVLMLSEHLDRVLGALGNGSHLLDMLLSSLLQVFHLKLVLNGLHSFLKVLEDLVFFLLLNNSLV